MTYLPPVRLETTSAVLLLDMTDDQVHRESSSPRNLFIAHAREHEQLIALRKENHQLQLQIQSDQQRTQRKKAQYEDRVHESDARCHDLTELIRKLQQHLRISQEKVTSIVTRIVTPSCLPSKLSEKAKALLEKDDTLRHYQIHVGQLNHRIKQLTNDASLAAVRRRQIVRTFPDESQ